MSVIESLWGAEFNIDTEEQTKAALKKIRKPKEVKATVRGASKKLSIGERISVIKEKVYRILGRQVGNVSVVKTKEDLHDYISVAIANGVLAVDTETNNSLDPLTCKLMGLCLYTPGQKQVYVPVNHIDYMTGERLPWQLTEGDIAEELVRLLTGIKLIFHNYKFDYQVLKCTCHVELPCYWDTLIAAKLIDENEEANLKTQYITHIDKEQVKYSIEKLFEKEKYEIFSPELFALYAATDSLMTYRLYSEYQKGIMESPDYSDIRELFFNVEMPCIVVVAEMELTGVEFDVEYSKRLGDKYHTLLKNKEDDVYAEIAKIQPDIDAWRLTEDATFKPRIYYKPKKTKKKLTPEEYERERKNIEKSYPFMDESGRRYKLGKSKGEQLNEVVNLGSPQQIAILVYDIMKTPPVDESKPRGTGDDILSQINTPLTNKLSEYREINKLITAFIDSLPTKINPVDGRIHCSFNQYGAKTGRFSSSEPNLQQIPSHNKEIRMLFKARDGYTLVGSDFSQQEPRLLSQLSGDENMINAYREGKDLYATIASGVYHNDYWDNMEHHKDGSANPEGKKRRGNCKSILLGIMYSRGPAAIAEQIHSTIADAQGIIDNFYKSFPRVKDTIDASHSMAKAFGYVTDLWGRRRRLPDINLPKFVVTSNNVSANDFNPFLNCRNRVSNQDIIDKYTAMLYKTRYKKEVSEIVNLAKVHGLKVVDNSGKISQAERQCLNARIQGSAATMTKIAMIKLYNDEKLREWGFKILIGVHDELIGECPKENADKVAERLCDIMKRSVEGFVNVPFKCDADICDRWYYNDYMDVVKEEYADLRKSGVDAETAFSEIAKEHCETPREELAEVLKKL